MPMLPLPGRSPRRYGRIAIIMGGLGLILLGLYLVMPYQFAGRCLWSAEEVIGSTTMSVRVYPAESSEDGMPGYPLLIFYRTGSSLICRKKAVTLQSDGRGLSFALSGTVLRISGGSPQERMWAMSVFLTAH